MKKIISICGLLTISFIVLMQPLHAQSVAINADSSKADASAILDLKSTRKGMLLPRMTMAQRNGIAAPATSLLIYQTDNTNGYYYYDGTAWTPLKSVSGGGGGGTDANWSAGNPNDIHNNNTGNVGIGTLFPVSKLTVLTPGGQYGITHTDGTITLSTYLDPPLQAAWFGTQSNHSLFFFAGNSSPRIAIGTTGNVGIGISNPVNKFQIGSFSGAPVSGNDFVITGSNNWLAMKAFTDRVEMATSGNLTLFPTGNLGFFTRATANKVQIGDAPGVSGTDFAIGGNGSWMAIKEFTDRTEMATSGNLAIYPNGFLGINTRTPRAQLDVQGFTPIFSSYYYFYNVNGVDKSGGCLSCTGNVSIYASASIMASEFEATSDARIKDIIGKSKGRKDLQTINALRVTDYTFKDKIQNGNKQYKKVIAQEVEKVYPQIVSKHTDVVPNVYQLSSLVEKTAGGYILQFARKHHISDSARKLQVILRDGHKQMVDILSIPAANRVEIAMAAIKTDTIFVYGEEVNDFRTVDYEGLTTLNISATQEISRLVNELKKTVAAQNHQIAQLKHAVALLQQPAVNKLSRHIISSQTNKKAKPVSKTL